MGDKSLQSLLMAAILAAACLVLSLTVGLKIGVAFLFNFLLFWCVGMAGFWVTETTFLFEAVRIVIITLSGGIFPLSVFGPVGEAVLKALALAWVGGLAVLGALLWRTGLRRFSAVGS